MRRSLSGRKLKLQSRRRKECTRVISRQSSYPDSNSHILPSTNSTLLSWYSRSVFASACRVTWLRPKIRVEQQHRGLKQHDPNFSDFHQDRFQNGVRITIVMLLLQTKQTGPSRSAGSGPESVAEVRVPRALVDPTHHYRQMCQKG